jgi:hypothetical protein
MAYDPKDPGGLLTAERPFPRGDIDYGYNSIGDHRFAEASGDRTLHVTGIEDRDGFASVMAPARTLTFVFYLDRGHGDPPSVNAPAYARFGPDDVVHEDEVDVLRVTFAPAG